MKKLLAGVTALTLTFGAFSCAVFADEYEESKLTFFNNTVEDMDDFVITANDYLELAVSPNGQFTMGTVLGNPDIDTDDNMTLLFGHGDEPWSSKSTVAIDGEAYSIGYSTSYIVSETELTDDNSVATTVYKYGDIEVTQLLSFITNVSTGRDDVVEIKYIVKNTGEETHSTGMRIMLDTKLNDNDKAPFRIPGVGEVLQETEFTGGDIPQYWQVFDSLSDPKVVAQGSFLRSPDNPPDAVQFVDFWHVNSSDNVSEMWNYEIDPDYSYTDSAVTVKWLEKELAPGEARAYTTYYGLSELSQTQGDVNLSMYSDNTVTETGTDEESGLPVFQPLDITAYVENIKDIDLTNPYVRIELPEGFTLAEGQSDKIPLGDVLSVNSRKQATWTVNVAGDTVPGPKTVTVYAGADEIEETQVSREITVPGEVPPPPDSSEPENSSAPDVSSAADSSSQTAPTSASSSASSSKTNAKDANPDTGSLSGIGLALAAATAAGIVVSRKNKRK